MINKHEPIKLILVLTIFVLSYSISYSQTKLDTVYYDANLKIVTDTALAETYEIRILNKRGKPNGTIKRFDKNDHVVERTTYVKGKKTGPYMVVKGDTIINGTYTGDRKIDLWTYENKTDHNKRIEMFDKKGKALKLTDSKLINSSGEDLSIEIDASFPGGPKAWGTFLRNNLKYPDTAKRANIQGQVILKFIVTASGDLKEIYVSSNPDQSLSLEALRVLKKSPRWIPKRVKGVPVESEMTLRIEFRLPNRG